MSETSTTNNAENLLPDFLESATSTFETMVFMPITFGDKQEKGKGNPRGAISGTISLTGEEQSGNLSLIFPMKLAQAVFRAMMMMGEDDPVDNSELNDVVGELANMVAGGAKSRLQEKDIHFKIGLPTVVVGEDHYLEPPRDVTTIVVPVSCAKGDFFIELSC